MNPISTDEKNTIASSILISTDLFIPPELDDIRTPKMKSYSINNKNVQNQTPRTLVQSIPENCKRLVDLRWKCTPRLLYYKFKVNQI